MDGTISYHCFYGCNHYQGDGSVSYLLEYISRWDMVIKAVEGMEINSRSRGTWNHQIK